MIVRRWRHRGWRLPLRRQHRYLSTATAANTTAITTVDRIRNIGIIAHIDAGKTTATERILYHTGKIGWQGDVDSGSTTTDYMPDERARGITIKSASTSVKWCDHRVNMIDTPGHVDFMVEVERSLRVLDGAVVVLDGLHGVQAQTSTVWRQADRHAVPRIAFVNKLDRPGANVDVVIRSMRQRLGCVPLPVQYAVMRGGDEFTLTSVVDLVRMESMVFHGEYGEHVTRTAVDDTHADYAHIYASRMALIEVLADHDDELAEWFLNDDDAGGGGLVISAAHLVSVIRRATLARAVVPVLTGSALNNIGIQPLLHAIVSYLPSPADEVTIARQQAIIHHQKLQHHHHRRHRNKRQLKGLLVDSGNADGGDGGDGELTTTVLRPDSDGPLVILAFKVVHDAQFGAIVMARVYSGTLRSGKPLVNVRTGDTVRPVRLLDVHADGGDTVSVVTAGNIVAMIGCKHTCTGDTLCDGGGGGGKAPHVRYELPRVHVPGPVFFHSIEATSPADESKLAAALAAVVLEDPSVGVGVDNETGQTVVKGMGELHLEIVQSRLLHHFKLSVDMGAMMIAFRETVSAVGTHEDAYYTEIGGRAQSALIKIRVEPIDDDDDDDDDGGSNGDDDDVLLLSSGNELCIDADFLSVVAQSDMRLSDDEWAAVQGGADDAMHRGPLRGYPMQGVRLTLYGYGRAKDTTPATFRSAAMTAVQRAVRAASPIMLEPVMEVEVVVDKAHAGAVLNDVPGRRRGRVVATESMSEKVMRIVAHIPLAECRDLASGLRGQTQGTASLTMEFTTYEPMPSRVLDKLAH